MELYQLVYLKEIYDCRSYTKAAAALKRTPSALTIAIQKLEEELGGQLFYKRGRLIEPSEICRKLLPIVEQTLIDMQKLMDKAAETTSEQNCTIDLGIPDLCFFDQIIEMKDCFASKGVTVNVHRNCSPRLEEDLKLGRLDMAILRKPLSHLSGFVCMDYRPEEFCAYCPATSQYAEMEYITLETLSSAVLVISREMRTLTPFIVSYLKQYSAAPENLCNDTLDLYSASYLARSQNGILIAPKFATNMEDMVARPIVPSLICDLVIGWDINTRQTAQQKELAQYILECVQPDKDYDVSFEVM